MTVPRRALLSGLAAALMSALASCGTGTGAGEVGDGAPGQVARRLEQMAAGAERPIYYLGERFRDWSLTEVLAEGTGRVDALYGECVGDAEGCAHPVNVINDVLDPEKWSEAVGCSRLPPVRGVPAVHFGEALVLLIGDLAVTIAVVGDDTETAIAAAEQLHAVGASGPEQALPPPDAAAVQVLGGACGRTPGETGAPLPDSDGPVAKDVHVPDFTVERLGGGSLRWVDYAGEPVVVVVGDVPDVAKGIRRVVALRAGARPTVIGLVWKPYGSKEAPAPIEKIENEAGNLPVPVGYAAIPRPAVWFIDLAEAYPEQSGVIAFVNTEGDVIRHVRTDAHDNAIITALTVLRR